MPYPDTQATPNPIRGAAPGTTAPATPPPSSSQQSSPLKPGAFLNRIVFFLMPYFTTVTTDYDIAYAEVVETLADYNARTRAEVINAARIVAFSFSALNMLADIQRYEMSPNLKARYAGCANGLNRACQQDEARLTKRLACDVPNKAAAPRQPAQTEPVNDVADPEVEHALDLARAMIDTYRNRPTSNPPSSNRPTSNRPPPAAPHAVPTPQQRGNHRLARSSILMDELAGLTQPGRPEPAA